MSYPPYQQQGYPAGPGYPPATGGMPQPAAAPAGLPYPAQPYPNQAGYPPAGAGSYPPQGGMPMPGQASYPPAGASPYPQAAAGAPYPPAGPPAGNSPYPGAPAGSSPYPGAPAGNSPYPAAHGGNSPYPGAPVGNSPYPGAPAGSSPYPGAPAGNSPYPGAPAGSSPYPSAPAGNTPYPSAPSAAPSNAPRQPQPSRGSISGQKSQSSSTKQAHSANTSDANTTAYYLAAKEPGDSGTVKPLTSGFNAEADATQIKNCLKSSFINETILVNIFPHRSNAQRQKIRLLYKTMYGKDMLEDLRARLSGDFESVTAALLMTPAEYDAYVINKAIQGAGTDEDALIQILCTRTNAQISELSAKYKEIYKASIEQQMQGDTSGHFMRMLISLSNGARQEDQGVNPQKAEDDAKKLYKAGAGRLGTDESTFNSIFVSQSFEQLKAVFMAYKRLYNKDMEKVIKSEMSGDLETGMKSIVRFTLDKHSYFANVLYKSMKGLGTDEKTLIRTLVSRSEIDLEQIKSAFNSIKGESKPLAHWIKKETSGPFRDMLMHIIGTAS